MYIQKHTTSLSNSQVSPYFVPQKHLWTIQQIYEVDTITLQQLIQIFQKQNCLNIENKLSSLVGLCQVKSINNKQFATLSSRNLRKWYQLAKIQLEERRKIEQFALRLIQDQTIQQVDYANSIYCTFGADTYKPNNKSEYKSQRKNIQIQVNKLNGAINKNQSTSLNLPPIIQVRSSSRGKLTSLHQQQAKSAVRNTQRLHQMSQPVILRPNQVRKITQRKMKTSLQGHRQTKELSKKQFLEMMRIKLNQGTVKQYKTGIFAKQIFPSKDYLQTLNTTERKISTKNKNMNKIQDKKKGQISKKSHTSNLKSTHIKHQYLQTRNRNDNNTNNIGLGPSKKPDDARNRNNSVYTPREQMQKGNYKQKYENTSNKQSITHQDQSHSKFNSDDRMKRSSTTVCMSSNILKKTQEQNALHLNKQDTFLFGLKQDQQLLRVNNQHRNQYVFSENQDIYDDQPQILQEVVALSVEQQLAKIQLYIEVQEYIGHQRVNQAQVAFCNTYIQEKGQIIKQILSQQIMPNYSDIFHEQICESIQGVNYDQNQNAVSQIKQSSEIEEFYEKINEDNFEDEQIFSIITNQEKPNSEQNQKDLKKNSIQNKTKTNISKNQQSNKLPITNGPACLMTGNAILNSAPKYPAYHLSFQSFTNLFHHVNTCSLNDRQYSLPYLLKTLQISLSKYFSQSIPKQSCQLMHSKMACLNNASNQTKDNSLTEHKHNEDIQVKLITQLQFLRDDQPNSIFNINLKTYKQRSFRFLNKLRDSRSYLDTEISVNKQGRLSQKQIRSQQFLFYRVVRTKTEVYDIVNSSFYRTDNWLELPHGMELQGCWNLLWTWSKPQIDFNSLIIFQKVNHFIGSKQLARKDLLKKNIEKIKKLSKRLNEYFDIIPQTFFLPGQNIQFIRKFRQSQIQGKNIWILKPVGLSRGRGISLISKLQQVVFSQPIVMQKYIYNPFLLDGYKFDLRIYVLVTSINPLECFIYKQGFARVSTQKYCNDLQQINNKYVHLTNYSIQKDSHKYPQIFSQQQKQLGGCKLTLKMLKDRLSSKGVQWQKMWVQVQQIVLKSLISCMKYIPHNPNCFQLFGYDIMLDSNFKCWLIQVNSSPSLEKDFMIDQIVKQQLIDDTIQVVQPMQFDRQQLLKVIRRRRKQFQGLKSHVNFLNNSTQQLNQDLFRILKGKQIRNYGQIKHHVNYKCLAPGPLFDKILKTVQHYTHDPFVKNTNFY